MHSNFEMRKIKKGYESTNNFKCILFSITNNPYLSNKKRDFGKRIIFIIGFLEHQIVVHSQQEIPWEKKKILLFLRWHAFHTKNSEV
jgi:hypothetical protein